MVGQPVNGEYGLPPGAVLEPSPEGAGPSAGCASCNGGGCGGYPYNRCGCNPQLFPYITGPGNCDNWCVGPHWNVELDGMFVHREDANWGAIAGADVVNQFDFGPGVRLFATGYNCSDYGLQIGYEGVNEFHSTALIGGGARSISYESNLNSVEINVLRRTGIPARLFAGFRYIELDEDFVDFTTATGDSDLMLIENRLIGFQIGALRDAWQLNKWLTFEPYGNAGMYVNDFKREAVDITAGIATVTEREISDVAFVGEAGLSIVLRINRCLALRSGYQAMALNGVGEALDSSLVAGLNEDTLIYHGARFGVEYQR
jgi:hypothetical protein